jgi:hypothetical protein
LIRSEKKTFCGWPRNRDEDRKITKISPYGKEENQNIIITREKEIWKE